MVDAAQIFLVVVSAFALMKLFNMLRDGGILENFSGATPEFPGFQDRIPVGNVQGAVLTSPGSGITGHGLLSVGNAHRSNSPNGYSFYIKAGLPLAEGGPVRFIHTKPAIFMTGKYVVHLENASGSKMPIPGEMVRLMDGSSRLSHSGASPAKYNGYDKVVVTYVRQDGHQYVVLSGSF